MKKIILLMVFMSLGVTVYASNLRLQGMGGTSIAISDDEKEALENPAKLVRIKQGTLLTDFKMSTFKDEQDSKYEVYSSSYIEKNDYKETFKENIFSLNCILPINTINTAFKAGVVLSNKNYKSNDSSEYNTTPQWNEENESNIDDSILAVSIGGAYKLDNFSFGVNFELTPSYEIENETLAITHSGSNVLYTTSTAKTKTETSIDKILIETGVNYSNDLLDIDVILGISPWTSERQQKSKSVNGVEDVNIDNKDNYPLFKNDVETKYVIMRPRYKLNEKTSLGLLLNYREDLQEETMETDTPQTEVDKYLFIDNTYIFSFGAGIVFCEEKDYVMGADFIVGKKYNKTIEKAGLVEEEIISNESLYFGLKLGAEKNLTDKLAIRIGSEVFRDMDNTQTTEDIDSYYNKTTNNSIGSIKSKISLGFGYDFADNLKLEYSFSSGESLNINTLDESGQITSHNIGITMKF